MRGRHRRSPLQADEHPILEVAGISARTSGGKVLLDDVSFAVQRGWLVAVVGPTGAGKTSLAQALTGGLAYEGTVRLEGIALAGAGTRHRDRIAFVPQDDVLHGQLDLGRTLGYAASLRAAPGSGDEERTRRVDSALRELGLHHHAGVPVASLSGGQRKRANIAAELVGQPDVLVLDEPTSGLDPGYEKAVMTSLRQLADAGRTVIAVTHSLAALAHCDRVLYLAEGGRVAYFGPPAACRCLLRLGRRRRRVPRPRHGAGPGVEGALPRPPGLHAVRPSRRRRGNARQRAPSPGCGPPAPRLAAAGGHPPAPPRCAPALRSPAPRAARAAGPAARPPPLDGAGRRQPPPRAGHDAQHAGLRDGRDVRRPQRHLARRVEQRCARS